MSIFIKKQSLSERRKSQPWTLKNVVETYSSKSYEQVIKEKLQKLQKDKTYE